MARFFKKAGPMDLPSPAEAEAHFYTSSKEKPPPHPTTPQASTFEQQGYADPGPLVPYDIPQASVRLVPSGQVQARREVVHLGFTPSGTHVVATVLCAHADPDAARTAPNHVFFWDARTLAEGHMLKTDLLKVSEAPRALGAVAFANRDVVACVFPRGAAGDEEHAAPSAPGRAFRLETHDLASRKRLMKSDVAIRAPVALSRDGTLIAGVSSTGSESNGRIALLRVNGPSSNTKQSASATATSAVGLFPVHLDDITHLQFTPDGRELVSLAKDGVGRVTNLKSGATKAKFHVEGRHNPRLLQVAPDGRLVASVWGYEVILWYPGKGHTRSYRLGQVRQSEGWPLCISPDCRFLACRNEHGIDILELMTGRFLGETLEMEASSFITASCFNGNGTMIAIGTYTGLIQMFRIVPES